MAQGSFEDERFSFTAAKVQTKIGSAKSLHSFLFPQHIRYNKSK